MSNLETAPVEFDCVAGASDRVEILEPRDVPLGGPRAMRVRRTLPQRQRSLVGAWCFADHYGPEVVGFGSEGEGRSGRPRADNPGRDSPGMDVPPHPHTGLQTVSWLFAGEIEHRDSAGVHAMVRPGELNLMTAGAGICHSEVSTAATTILHGMQLWVALPASARDVDRGFDHYAPQPVTHSGAVLTVFLGTLADERSPVPTHTPLLGAQIDLPVGASVELDVDPSFEHGLLVDLGTVEMSGTAAHPGELAYRGPGARALTLTNCGVDPVRAVLLGGPPLREELVMWWNFLGRSHEDIVEFRAQWESESARFGAVHGYRGTPQRLPAPPLPATRLKPRQPPSRRDAQ